MRIPRDMQLKVKKLNFLRYSTLRIFWRKCMKVCFSIENFGKSHSRKIFRCCMKMFKVSKSFSEHSSTRLRKNDGRTTRRSRDMQLKVKKLNFLRYPTLRIFWCKSSKKSIFSGKLFLKSLYKIFQMSYEAVQGI